MKIAEFSRSENKLILRNFIKYEEGKQEYEEKIHCIADEKFSKDMVELNLDSMNLTHESMTKLQ